MYLREGGREGGREEGVVRAWENVHFLGRWELWVSECRARRGGLDGEGGREVEKQGGREGEREGGGAYQMVE